MRLGTPSVPPSTFPAGWPQGGPARHVSGGPHSEDGGVGFPHRSLKPETASADAGSTPALGTTERNDGPRD